MEKNKLKIGIDLDNVVYDFSYPFIQHIKDKGYNVDKHSYDYGLTKEVKSELIEEFGKKHPFLWIPIYNGVVESIDNLKKYADIYIITDRDWYEGSTQETKSRLSMDNIHYDKLIFSSEKGDYSKYLDLDIFFEDSLKNVKDILHKSETFIYLINQPYNKGFTNERVKRIKSLNNLLKEK